MQLSEGLIVAEHYKLLKQLGQGSFGDVWLAHNLLADIDVAIKFYGTFDQKGLEEFRNEFKIAYKLHHPNLLNINHFDVFTANSRQWSIRTSNPTTSSSPATAVMSSPTSASAAASER